jgi:hypothetical protein
MTFAQYRKTIKLKKIKDTIMSLDLIGWDYKISGDQINFVRKK